MINCLSFFCLGYQNTWIFLGSNYSVQHKMVHSIKATNWDQMSPINENTPTELQMKRIVILGRSKRQKVLVEWERRMSTGSGGSEEDVFVISKNLVNTCVKFVCFVYCWLIYLFVFTKSSFNSQRYTNSVFICEYHIYRILPAYETHSLQNDLRNSQLTAIYPCLKAVDFKF